MAGQGRYISEERIRQIVHLLSSTEMPVNDIAARMSCSSSTIISINRKFEVRQYKGLRSSWSKAIVDKADVKRSSRRPSAKKK
jgi:DNA-binding MurR/RpiR family transcriptional regulator